MAKEQGPMTKEHEPMTEEQRPMTRDGWPMEQADPAGGRRPSVIGCWPSAIPGQ
jgi:hypothetical protein